MCIHAPIHTQRDGEACTHITHTQKERERAASALPQTHTRTRAHTTHLAAHGGGGETLSLLTDERLLGLRGLELRALLCV